MCSNNLRGHQPQELASTNATFVLIAGKNDQDGMNTLREAPTRLPPLFQHPENTEIKQSNLLQDIRSCTKLTIIITVFASKIGISNNPNKILVDFFISQGHIIQILKTADRL